MTVPAAPRRPHRVGLAPAGVVVLLVLVLLAGGTAGLVAGRRRAAERETQDYLAERARAGAFTLSPLAVTDRLVTRRPTLILDVRSRREFADVRLRSARNLPLPDLLAGGSDDLGALPIVVVDRDGTAAVEGMVLLRLAGKPAFAMTGGMERLQRLLARPGSIPRRSAAAGRAGDVRALLTGRARRSAPAGGPAEGGSSPAQVPGGGDAAEPSAAVGLLPGILAGLVAFTLMAVGWRWFERRHRPVQDALSLLARDHEQAWHTVVDRLSKGGQPPRDPAAQFALAYARARLGRLTEASAVVAAMPPASRDPAALHLDLWLKLEQHQYEEATTLWERAASEKLKDHEESRRLASLAYLALARQALADRDIDQALHRFDQVRDLGVLNERVPDTAARYWTLDGMDKLLDQDPRAAREAFRRAEAATADGDHEGTLLARLGVLLCDWRATEGAPADDNFDRRLGATVEAVRADQGLFPADRQRLLRDLALWQTVARVAGWKRRTVPGRGLPPQELEDFRAAVAEVRSHDPTMPDPDLVEGLIQYFLADPGDRPVRERALRQIRRAADGGVTLQEVLDLLEGPADAADGVDEYLSLLGGYLQDSRVPPAIRWQVRRHLGRFGRVQRLLETDLRAGDQELAPSVADLKARGELLQERVGSLVLPELGTVDPDQARQVRGRLRRLERTVVLLSKANDRFAQLEQQLVILTGELLLADEPAG